LGRAKRRSTAQAGSVSAWSHPRQLPKSP